MESSSPPSSLYTEEISRKLRLEQVKVFDDDAEVLVVLNCIYGALPTTISNPILTNLCITDAEDVNTSK